jgi:hypothetical protein
MGPKKAGGEGSKKAQGQARKAEAAAGKQAQKEAESAAAEAQKWDTGSKSNSKAYVAVHHVTIHCLLVTGKPPP